MFFKNESNTAPNDSLKNYRSLDYFPQEELYRLVVDGGMHKNQRGWVGYESREPGCLKAFFEGLQFINQSIDRPLSIEYIQTIHYLVDRFSEYSEDWRSAPGHFRGGYWSEKDAPFGLNEANTSLDGILEFIDDLESSDEFAQLSITISRIGTVSHASLQTLKEKYKVENNEALAKIIYEEIKNNQSDFHSSYHGDNLYKIIPKYIEEYNQAIKQNNNLDDKLHAIAKLVGTLEKLHPFRDRNIRTLVLLTLYRAFMQNNLILPLFENPNKFDMHSLKEKVQMMKDGMYLTEQLLQGKAVFSFDTKSMNQEDKQKFKEISRIFQTAPPEFLLDCKKHEAEFSILHTSKKVYFLLTEIFDPAKEIYGEREKLIEAANGDDKLAKQFKAFMDSSAELDDPNVNVSSLLNKLNHLKTTLPANWCSDHDKLPKDDFHECLEKIIQPLGIIEKLQENIANEESKLITRPSI